MFTLGASADSNDILKTIEETGKSVFITGQAGTGKSTLLRQFRSTTEKNVIVIAPTGIAALNVEGQTIHAFFRFLPSTITEDKVKIIREKTELFENIDTIIIDEISMVRIDVMDGIDCALRKYRKNDKPFGGVQTVFFGDLFQLSPIVGDNAANEFITSNYPSPYFFDANVFKNIDITVYELTKVYRQTDSEFVDLLNRIRINEAKDRDLDKLNSNNVVPKSDDEYVYLTARRITADEVNTAKLNSLPGKKFISKCEISGNFADYSDKTELTYPAPETLELKPSSKIMMLVNDISKRWVNGSRGKVVNFGNDYITVSLDNNEHQVNKHTWKQMEYTYNSVSRKIEEKQVGTFTQYPIQLANAITIHKSQGMTLDKVIVDIGMGAFAHGQVYVALSRCRAFSNLVIKSYINQSDIMIDPLITDFYNKLHSVQKQSVLSEIDLIREFEKDLNKYMDIIKERGYRGATRVTRNFQSAISLAKIQTPKATEILWRLKEEFKSIEYCIEALCIKKKYNDIVPLD